MSTMQPFDTKKEYSVLFIGNSYTFFHDMPKAIFEPLAQAAGVRVKVTAITKGGYTLKKFSNAQDEHGARVFAALEGAGKGAWDVVILQEQSVLPAAERQEEFFSAVRDLTARIRALGAQPALYATWGRKTGNETLAQYGWTNAEMTQRLADAYGRIGAELDVPVAHVGLAFYDVYQNHPEIELYDPDKTHPSYAGSYLAALTMLARIFGVDPTAVPYDGALPCEVAEVLKAAALRAVEG
ncbi:MAG: hypothetical protein IJW50_06270 [Clostridia bacterium]|nr:hypothetical protein [Clostridia bacterium]